MSQRNRVSRKDDPDAQEEREIWSRITKEMQQLKILHDDIAKNKSRIEELEETCSAPDGVFSYYFCECFSYIQNYSLLIRISSQEGRYQRAHPNNRTRETTV